MSYITVHVLLAIGFKNRLGIKQVIEKKREAAQLDTYVIVSPIVMLVITMVTCWAHTVLACISAHDRVSVVFQLSIPALGLLSHSLIANYPYPLSPWVAG